MNHEEIIEKAVELLKPIDFEPEYTGYYIRKNGDDIGETFCINCIKEQVKLARKWHREQRHKIIDDFMTLEKTGKWRGKKLKKNLSAEELKKAKRFHLKEYPAKVSFEIESCDPDFGGGRTEPKCCDNCGKYFHTNFEPDLEYANYLLEDFNDYSLSPEMKWKLDIAFYNYDYLDSDVQAILITIAKKIIQN